MFLIILLAAGFGLMLAVMGNQISAINAVICIVVVGIVAYVATARAHMPR